MKHALIVAHPSTASFAISIAGAYAAHAQELGHQVVLRDLYREHFDPRLQDEEIPRPAGFSPAADVVAERAAIGDADVFAFIYPLWFNAPPAILVGYVQRVFGMGFGYGSVHDGGNEPLLTGRRLISFSTSGAPKAWLESEGGWSALRNLFDHHVAGVCGLTVADHVHFGGITSQTRPDVIERHLSAVKQTVSGLSGVSSL